METDELVVNSFFFLSVERKRRLTQEEIVWGEGWAGPAADATTACALGRSCACIASVGL